MPTDLHSIYKSFYQRSHRDPYDDDYLLMTELIRDLVITLYRERHFRNKNLTSMPKKVRKEALRIANNLLEMEIEKGGFSVYFSERLINALENEDYTIDIPPQKISRWVEKSNYYGNLYVLTSEHRPGQCKLGVTRDEINNRIKKIRNRHGYPIELYFLRIDILSPFKHEAEIAKKYQEYRHSGHTYGDSIEWYHLDPEILKNEILSINQDLSV